MALSTTITIQPNTWTLVNSTAVSALRIQNKGVFSVELKGTATNAAPTDFNASITLDSGLIISTNNTLASLFPGVISSAGYLWVYSDHTVDVSVSHA